MSNTSRRRFISNSGKAAMAGTAIFAAGKKQQREMKNVFIHHVYFWLKNPDNNADKQKLIEGLQKLSKIKTIKSFHTGVPAGTSRDVIDSSYSVSWMLLFDSAAAQDSYQTDPIHLKFVEECSSLWEKVVVYDTVDT